MPRACTICAHADRKIIDAMIANKEPYLRIATKFGLNDKTVSTHGKNHVLPFMDSVELQAQAAVLSRVMEYRDEVNLPLPEKSKYIENRLWDDYFAVDDPVAKMAVVREIAKQQQEQAKLAGAYIKEKENPATEQAVAERVFRRMVNELGMEPEVARANVLQLYPAADVKELGSIG
jgi:RPA family protein